MAEPKSRPPAGFPAQRVIGFVGGPVAFLIMLVAPAPEDLSAQGWSIAAVGMWMAIWWMTEAVPLAVTALLPIALFPTLGVRGIEQTTPSYAHPLVFLFLGGFLLARAMNVWSLDRRLAITVLRWAGSSPRGVVAATMIVTAFLSMWVSNTATTMVMLPIGLSLVATLSENGESHGTDVGPAMLLGIAYAATIGGMGTIVGTPPNALFAAFMSESYGVEVSFFKWMLIGVPMVIILLPIAWFVLTHVTFRIEGRSSPRISSLVASAHARLEPMSRAEFLVAAVMLLVAACWVFRPLMTGALPWLSLSDAGIGIAGAILLFLIPVDLKAGRFLLSWKEAVEIRWDVLILFGGGLALAAGIGDSDLASWIGTQMVELEELPMFLLVLAIGVLVVFLGELASNTAMAAVFLPVAGAAALGMGEPAVLLALPVALFATLGFMLPVATPPNAVIFGSGVVEMRHMLRAGIILDVVGILVVAAAIHTLGQWLFV